LKNRKKKKLGSYPYLSVVLSITLALFLIGLLGLMILHANRLTSIIRENITMQVYLQKTVTENDRIRINKLLSEKEYIAKKSTNPEIVYISRDEAAKSFASKTGEDFVAFLGENPLRDAFVITIAPEYQTEESMTKIQAELSKTDSVFEVAFTPSLVQTINSNAATITIILAGVTIIVLLTIVILINNTIKLALFSQRFLIRSMQLVGAKTGFIIWPFVRSASIHGLVAGLFASMLLFAAQKYAYTMIKDLNQIDLGDSLLILYALLLTIGIVIGAASTLTAVRRYLKMSLNELY
jgi:cell division transport system permease protein